MIPVGQKTARALTEQFYRWELRGRGWFMWPQTVQLEPPFRPFEGHFLSSGRVVDDGQIESFGSRFARGVTGLLGFAPPSITAADDTEEIEEPDAERQNSRDDLVELQIALPLDYQPQANVFEQFLFSIGYASDPVAFEVVGSAEELVVQVTAGAADAEAVRQQLKAFFPEATITQGDDHLGNTFSAEAENLRVQDFGLEREFMVPLQSLKAVAADPLVAMCGALDHLQAGEAGAFQVVLEPVRHPWAPSMVRAVSLGDGKPFFANDPELTAQTRVKVTRPLFAVVVRVIACAPDDERVAALIRAMAGALRPLGNPQGNHLVPLTDEEYEPGSQIIDVLFRETHRSGMLLNSDEVVALAHLPTAAVRAKSLRRALQKTRLAPRQLITEKSGVWIGDNLHEGILNPMHLPMEMRLNHCHILGGTGSGKSTLLALMAMQDIVRGHGVAVVDPHGDLIDLLLPHVPPDRLDDVILFDPSDEEFAIGFNPLAASSTREKELLAADFIAVMRQHTSSWGDQMSSILGNAVLAFLHNSRTGTLPELRRFLVNEDFRTMVLNTVTSAEVAYFWEHEAALTNKTAIGSILVRLDELLRSESLLHILGQRANKLDFGDIMDSGKIFLARMSKGLIERRNAYLLGSLLVSKFYQTTIARQSRQREQRQPYMLLMDEAGELLTSTISEILIGTRKYGLGLTLAHQSLRQLTGNDEVYGAVTGCGTKICFQLGGDDARKMADEFGGFVAADLMNLPKLHAIARVGPRDASFNLETHFIPPPPRPLKEARADLLDRTRRRYATPKADIQKEMESLRQFLPKKKVADPFSDLTAKQKRDRKEREGISDTGQPNSDIVTGHAEPKVTKSTQAPPTSSPLTSSTSWVPSNAEPPPPTSSIPPLPVSPSSNAPQSTLPPLSTPPAAAKRSSDTSDPQLGTLKLQPRSEPRPTKSDPTTESDGEETLEPKSGKAEAIKNALVQAAGCWGFSYETEVEILGGAGRVDLVLTLGNRRFACEISATTTAEQEVNHLLNCLSHGFQEIVCVCDATVRRNRIEALLRSRIVAGQEILFHFLTAHQLQTRLADIGQAAQKSAGGSAADKAIPGPVINNKDVEEETKRNMLREIGERRTKAKAGKERHQIDNPPKE